MSLSQFIRDNTNDGRDMAGVLIDVMNGRIDGTKVGHRLTAARLLIIYGYDDADDFIADNAPITSETDPDDKVWGAIDPALTRLIRSKTDDGHAICLFLIEIMQGKVEGANVGHRVSAARELLNRGFGRYQSRPLPKPPGSTPARRSTHKTHQRVASSRSPASVRPEPVEERSVPPTQTAVLDEPEQQPEFRTRGVEPIYIDSEPFYLESELVMTYEGCEDPNFDPYRAIHDEEYARTYTGCPDPECEVHGQPKEFDFDPNDHHY